MVLLQGKKVSLQVPSQCCPPVVRLYGRKVELEQKHVFRNTQHLTGIP